MSTSTLSLRDLKLAGVQWELYEVQSTIDVSVSDIPASGPKKQDDIKTIPPTAPINTDVAQDIAKTIDSLPALCTAIEAFEHPLRQFVKNAVMPHFASEGTGLLIITDAPGPDDEASGKILTGASGELMDKMLSAIDLRRENVSILPLIFWRTPGGRTPTSEELNLTRPFIDRAIDLLKPRFILTLGTLVAAEIAGSKLPRDHGKSSEFKVQSSDNDNLESIRVMSIYHPNYLILKPDAKRDVWAALQNLQNLLKTA